MLNYKKAKSIVILNCCIGKATRHWNKQKSNYFSVICVVVVFMAYGIVGAMEYKDEMAIQSYHASAHFGSVTHESKNY